MSDYQLRPTVAEDFTALDGKPLPFRVRAKTAVLDGRVIGLGGIGHLEDGTVIAFGRITDEFRRHPVKLHKAGLEVFREARERGIREIFATADPSVPRAGAWLERLGFSALESDGKTVWVMR